MKHIFSTEHNPVLKHTQFNERGEFTMKRMIFSKRFSILSLLLVIALLLTGQPALVSAQSTCLPLCVVSGKVGIGTTSPARPLEVATTTGGTANHLISFLTTADGGKGSLFGIDTTNRKMYWRLNDSGDYGFQFQNGQGKPAMTILNGGNIGIGTTSPARPLEIAAATGGATNNLFSFLTTADGGKGSLFGIDTTNRKMYWRLNDSGDYGFQFQNAQAVASMTILNGGNVGIGTVAPEQKLDVNGGVRIGSDLVMRAGSDRGDGGRALVHDNGDTLVINYAGDFAGGVRVGRSLSVPVLNITGGSDLAEPFEITGIDEIQPGMVVAIDQDNPGQLRRADVAYDRTVAGVVSGAAGVNPGLVMQQEGTIAAGRHPVALSGRVYVYADASNGAIAPGDLLTTSATPGHAMKVTDHDLAQGAILGKAMSKLEQGTGLVLVLVTLQ